MWLNEGEPIASEGWVEEYQQKQEPKLTLSGSFSFVCANVHGKCNSEYLQNPNEFQCCFGIDECME